jgi:hypothetical protein
MRYFGGFVEGVDEWTIQSSGGRTRATDRLDVIARGWPVAVFTKFMNLSASHSRAMRDFLRQLAAAVPRS